MRSEKKPLVLAAAEMEMDLPDAVLRKFLSKKPATAPHSKNVAPGRPKKKRLRSDAVRAGSNAKRIRSRQSE